MAHSLWSRASFLPIVKLCAFNAFNRVMAPHAAFMPDPDHRLEISALNEADLSRLQCYMH